MSSLAHNVAPCPLVWFVESGAASPSYLWKPHAVKVPAIGPGGRMGQLESVLPGTLEFLEAGQTWTALPGQPGVWLGVIDGARIDPAHLARPTQRPGHWVKLGDGSEWLVPVARLRDGGCALPRRRALTPDGSIGWNVEAEFRGLTDFAGRVWDAHMGQAYSGTEAEIDAMCAAALGVNYALGLMECIVLGLFTDSSQRLIAEALIDWPTVEAILEELKKKQASPGG